MHPSCIHSECGERIDKRELIFPWTVGGYHMEIDADIFKGFHGRGAGACSHGTVVVVVKAANPEALTTPSLNAYGSPRIIYSATAFESSI